MTTYDYIIVGGGTAGCVIAARLTEDVNVSVLLLEAGGDDRRQDVQTPDRWEELQGTDADWAFETVLQPDVGRVFPAPRGKVLGGSGSINCMTHLRGHRLDYEDWAAAGATGWDYAGVLGYFKRSEDVPDGDPRYRGRGGPLQPRVAIPASEFGQAYIEGAVKRGHQRTVDFSGPEMMGAGATESLVLDGRRESTATAYLRPAMERKNLAVITEALALSLVIVGARCTGVSYMRDGSVHTASGGEVVLCAGAIGSPHMLMLSGIGPAAELAAVGVRAVHDLPGVGKNLQDHLLLAGVRYHPERPVPHLGNGEGMTVFARTPGDNRGPDLHLAALSLDWHLPSQLPSPNAYTMAVGHMRPRSRGEVRLRTAELAMPPIIDPQYLSDPYDLEALIRGVEMVEEIVQTGALSEWGGYCDTTKLLELDRSRLEREIKAASFTYSHLSGSCRAGQDAQSVVDPQLRVHGIEGLRVADASIMPFIVSCNTNGPALMIGEKTADLLRGHELRDDVTAIEDWGAAH